jgi:hypothetical protein
MKILIETSTLVSGSISWEYSVGKVKKIIEHKFYKKSYALFCSCNNKKMQEKVIITKTVEDEAKNALNKAVDRTIRDRAPRDIIHKYNYMVLQHLILNDSLDKLDYYVEECSTRLPINTTIRNKIRDSEIEPYLKSIIINTIRFIHPQISRVVKGKDFRIELIQKMVTALPEKGTIYKGMPEERDMTIMAEATLLKRKYANDGELYVASLDNHFKPNPIQVYSYLSPDMMFMGLDSKIRDLLRDKFGFIGEDPQQITQIIQELK